MQPWHKNEELYGTEGCYLKHSATKNYLGNIQSVSIKGCKSNDPVFTYFSSCNKKTLSKKGKIEEKQLSKDLDILATYI